MADIQRLHGDLAVPWVPGSDPGLVASHRDVSPSDPPDIAGVVELPVTFRSDADTSTGESAPVSLNLERLYEYRFKDVDQQGRNDVWGEVSRFLWDRYGRPQTVLDPAAGIGEFIANVPARDRWAVDLVDHGLTRVPGVTTRIASFFDADLPESHFELIFASNLLEHLASPDEIARFLVRCRSLLAPGGSMVVMGPNFRYCADRYFDCADHVLPLTHVAVAEHLYAAGLDVADVVPRFLPYAFRSRLPASSGLVGLYLRVPLAWRFLGKQFLVVGRRSP